MKMEDHITDGYPTPEDFDAAYSLKDDDDTACDMELQRETDRFFDQPEVREIMRSVGPLSSSGWDDETRRLNRANDIDSGYVPPTGPDGGVMDTLSARQFNTDELIAWLERVADWDRPAEGSDPYWTGPNGLMKVAAERLRDFMRRAESD